MFRCLGSDDCDYNLAKYFSADGIVAAERQIRRTELDAKSAKSRQKVLQCLVKSVDSSGQSIDYESYRTRNPPRVPGTCTWFLEHPKFKVWRSESSSSLLWLSADPGCGKSVLASFLVEELQTTSSQEMLPGTTIRSNLVLFMLFELFCISF